jgi:hypothetical protein
MTNMSLLRSFWKNIQPIVPSNPTVSQSETKKETPIKILITPERKPEAKPIDLVSPCECKRETKPMDHLVSLEKKPQVSEDVAYSNPNGGEVKQHNRIADDRKKNNNDEDEEMGGIDIENEDIGDFIDGELNTRGENRVYEALSTLADEIDRIAQNMQSYDYPPEAEVTLLLEQQNYTSGGLARKELSSETNVAKALSAISKLKAKLKNIREIVAEVQESCYKTSIYDQLYNESKMERNESTLEQIYQRKEDQRKARGKRERQAKARRKRRDMRLKAIITQASRRQRRRINPF